MVSPALPILLIARSAGQLPGTLTTVGAAGYSRLIGLPVSTTSPAPFENTGNATALILTSPNSLSNPAVQSLNHLPVYAVGPATAEAAAHHGFTIRYVGESDAAHMAETLCSQQLPPQTFVHLHASNAGTLWYAALRAAGHTLIGQTAYITTPVKTIAADVLQQLQHTPPTHALVFSQGGAHNLNKLLTRHNLPWPPVTVAISGYTAHGLPGEVRVPPSPNLPSMLTCLP